LLEMTNYSESAVCRRRQLLHYFGESLDKDCGFCDNCRHPKEKFEGREHVGLALRAVVQTEARFGLDHVAQVLLGLSNPHIESYGHNGLPVYGQGKTLSGDMQLWLSVLRQCLLNGMLEKDIDSIGLIHITEKGIGFIENPHSFTLTKDHDFEAEKQEEEDVEKVQQAAGHDEALFVQLKELRKQVAKQKNLPPYVLFQDPSLKEMATTYPQSLHELTHISGVGQGKAQKFGVPFVAAIKKYVEDNDIATAADVIIKSTVNRSKLKIYIIQQIDKKMDLAGIARSQGISMADLVEEVEHICYSGTRLNLDYYIQDVVDEDKQDEIYDYFMTAATDNIAVAMNELGPDDYTEEEVRLMRIKFLSEVAN
jgi:ATP-dependent DNA helicase RecQ